MHRSSGTHYQPRGLVPGEGALGAVPTQLPIQAIPYNTVPAPTTPWLNSGTYTGEIDGRWQELPQPIVVKQDPQREGQPALTMQQVYTLTKARCTTANCRCEDRRDQLGLLRQQVAKLRHRGPLQIRSPRSNGRPRRSRHASAGGRRWGGGGGAGAAVADLSRGAGRHIVGREHVARPADERHAGGRRGPDGEYAGRSHAAQQNAARVMARWTALTGLTVDLRRLNTKLKRLLVWAHLTLPVSHENDPPASPWETLILRRVVLF